MAAGLGDAVAVAGAAVNDKDEGDKHAVRSRPNTTTPQTANLLLNSPSAALASLNQSLCKRTSPD